MEEVKIAVVDDAAEDAEKLRALLERYAEEKKLSFQIIVFTCAEALLDHYSADYDVVFMDIRMPYLDGMSAAQRLRELDASVLLIFATSLSQYAVQSYAVEAADYIVKPFTYYDLAPKLSRAVRRLAARGEGVTLLQIKDELIRLRDSQILYVESKGHRVIFHTGERDYERRGAISALEKTLGPRGFARCNSCYLVNLKYVSRIKGFTVTVGQLELQISQPRKKTFMQALVAYTEGKGT